MIQGSLVAIVTPMTEDGSLDYPRLEALIDWHIAEGSNGIVIVGTTGESPTVSFDEHCALIRFAVQKVAGRVPVVAGTGGNATREAIHLSRCAADAGATACLSVAPYYNKPTQEGMYRHFRAIAEAVDIPQMLYNVPGRTVADIANETVLRLAEIPNIVGLKDATGNIGRFTELTRRLPEDFTLLSGDDATSLAFMLMGGHGVVSVTANVAPAAMRRMCDLARAGDIAAARAINDRLYPLHVHLFAEANPIPVKWALARMGRIAPGIRLPLTPLSEAAVPRVEAALAEAGLLDDLS